MDDWGLYLACGNEGDEGESGQTWNNLMTSAVQVGWDSVSISPDSFNEKTVIDLITADYTFASAHGADTTTAMKITWKSGFEPSKVYLGT